MVMTRNYFIHYGDNIKSTWFEYIIYKKLKNINEINGSAVIRWIHYHLFMKWVNIDEKDASQDFLNSGWRNVCGGYSSCRSWKVYFDCSSRAKPNDSCDKLNNASSWRVVT
jgi:hypothetical protein